MPAPTENPFFAAFKPEALTGNRFLQTQANVLAQLETLGTAWMQRRQEALHDLRCYAERVAATKDPADFMRAQQDLITGAVTRLSGDIAAFQQAAASLLESPAAMAAAAPPVGVTKQAA
jgi:hypothetical protein